MLVDARKRDAGATRALAVGESPLGLRGGIGKTIEAQSAKHDEDGQTQTLFRIGDERFERVTTRARGSKRKTKYPLAGYVG